MAGRLSVELITPERAALAEAADAVVLPAIEGEMGVLPGHEPYMVQLSAGEVRLSLGAERKSFAVSGGFAEILDNKVAIFAETAEMAEEIDAERARQSLERAKAEAQASRLDPLTLAQAEAAMRRAQVRLKIAELRRMPRKPPQS